MHSQNEINLYQSNDLPEHIDVKLDGDTKATVAKNATVQIETMVSKLVIPSKSYLGGAYLKDLGEKWFAFSKMDSFVEDVLSKLKQGGEDE